MKNKRAEAEEQQQEYHLFVQTENEIDLFQQFNALAYHANDLQYRKRV